MNSWKFQLERSHAILKPMNFFLKLLMTGRRKFFCRGEEAEWEMLFLNLQRNKHPVLHSPVNQDAMNGKYWN